MAHRREVFQSKVFQKLYPSSSTLKKAPSPPHVVESLTNKAHGKRKASEDNTPHGKRPSAANPGRRMYTVLPPPPGYDLHSQESVGQTGVEDPAVEQNESDEDSDEESEEEEQSQKRRKSRRKRKRAPHPDPGAEPGAGQSRAPAAEGGERISRNKKRKLKKKRHRQKLLSMGLVPRAAALEFTYQKDAKEEEEEEARDKERKAAEVSDFLRTTMEIYMSDSSLHAARVPHLSATVDDLLGGIGGGGRRDSVLTQLYNLKVFVQRRETDRLEKALEELASDSVLSAEEAAAVVSLFQYWITDILPMQGDEKTGPSATHP